MAGSWGSEWDQKKALYMNYGRTEQLGEPLSPLNYMAEQLGEPLSL